MLLTEKPASELGLKAFSHPARAFKKCLRCQKLSQTRDKTCMCTLEMHSDPSLSPKENSNSRVYRFPLASVCRVMHTMFMRPQKLFNIRQFVSFLPISEYKSNKNLVLPRGDSQFNLLGLFCMSALGTKG